MLGICVSANAIAENSFDGELWAGCTQPRAVDVVLGTRNVAEAVVLSECPIPVLDLFIY